MFFEEYFNKKKMGNLVKEQFFFFFFLKKFFSFFPPNTEQRKIIQRRKPSNKNMYVPLSSPLKLTYSVPSVILASSFFFFFFFFFCNFFFIVFSTRILKKICGSLFLKKMSYVICFHTDELERGTGVEEKRGKKKTYVSY